MRITFVIPFPGLHGGIRVIGVYAERLARQGHEVTVVATAPEPIPLRRKAKSLVLGRGWVKAEGAPAPFFSGKGIHLKLLDSFRPVTDSDVPDADVIVATWWVTAHWVKELSARKGAKVLFIQGYEVQQGKTNSDLDATWQFPMRKIVVSKWLRDLARERFGDPSAVYVPNGVDAAQFYSNSRGRQATPTVGVVYSSSWFKGWPTTVRALRQLQRQLGRLRVIGFGGEPPGMFTPLPDGLEFHHRPSQSRLRDLYSMCDVWLCGSNNEGFGLPVLEAMACRCPVVSTRVGGPVEMVEDGINGHLADVGDAEGLAHHCQRVIQLSEESWKRMSDAALATANRYNWDRAADLFEAALLEASMKSGS